MQPAILLRRSFQLDTVDEAKDSFVFYPLFILIKTIESQSRKLQKKIVIYQISQIKC